MQDISEWCVGAIVSTDYQAFEENLYKVLHKSYIIERKTKDIFLEKNSLQSLRV